MISNKFRKFSINECSESSPLYESLALKVAEDAEMIELASSARKGQLVPNLLFDAVSLFISERV
ncbi:DUF2332 family protein [Mesobacillus subterraneus]|uniref:DUF2332 family protein n=1 Tax=Mesobacillus subterraneus TaxID=285983 RepID=UPI0035324572